MNVEAEEKLLRSGPEVSAALLPVIFEIFSQWQLTGAQQMILLGLSNEKTLYNWKNTPVKAKLSKDLLERTSYILGIYKSLEILLSDPELANNWLTVPNDNPLFESQPPLDHLLQGKVVDLAQVRDFLDNERGGW